MCKEMLCIMMAKTEICKLRQFTANMESWMNDLFESLTVILSVSGWLSWLQSVIWLFQSIDSVNQATGYASQHIWCLPQARMNWEGFGRKGIWYKNGAWWRWIVSAQPDCRCVCLSYLPFHHKVPKKISSSGTGWPRVILKKGPQKWLCACVIALIGCQKGHPCTVAYVIGNLCN